MKNTIYLTQEGKEEIESLIIGLKLKESSGTVKGDYREASYYYAKVQILEEILENHQILPTEKIWVHFNNKTERLSPNPDDYYINCHKYFEELYPNGVIIEKL